MVCMHKHRVNHTVTATDQVSQLTCAHAMTCMICTFFHPTPPHSAPYLASSHTPSLAPRLA